MNLYHVVKEQRHPSMYIHPKAETYETEQERFFCNILGALINQVGTVLMNDECLGKRFTDKYNKPRVRAIKNYIAANATNIIKNLSYVDSNAPNPPMRFVSKRQINKLRHKQPCDVTCYAAIIVYVCISLILQYNQKPDDIDLLDKNGPLSIAMREIRESMEKVRDGERDNQQKLALFLLQCIIDADKQYAIHGNNFTEFHFSALPTLT